MRTLNHTDKSWIRVAFGCILIGAAYYVASQGIAALASVWVAMGIFETLRGIKGAFRNKA